MRAYISISFSKRKDLQKELNAIISSLKKINIEAFVFVDEYHFDTSREKEMMQKAIASIDDSDLLIAETSEKAIGIGIEAGYAKAKNKPIIYIRNTTAEHSTTVSGISDFQIIYEDETDLENKLTEVLNQLKYK